MRLTFERGGGGGAGVVAGMVVGLLLCCSAFTRQPPQVAAAALYKLLYRLPHHSAMSLAPRPAAPRSRKRCRYVMRLETSREGRGRRREKPVTRAKIDARFCEADSRLETVLIIVCRAYAAIHPRRVAEHSETGEQSRV